MAQKDPDQPITADPSPLARREADEVRDIQRDVALDNLTNVPAEGDSQAIASKPRSDKPAVIALEYAGPTTRILAVDSKPIARIDGQENLLALQRAVSASLRGL